MKKSWGKIGAEGASLVLFAIGWAIVIVDFIAVVSRVGEIIAAPDLNGDGQFTISDFGKAIPMVVFSLGHYTQKLIADWPIAAFLEMRADQPNPFWSGIISFFGWIAPIGIFRWAAQMNYDAL